VSVRFSHEKLTDIGFLHEKLTETGFLIKN